MCRSLSFDEKVCSFTTSPSLGLIKINPGVIGLFKGKQNNVLIEDRYVAPNYGASGQNIHIQTHRLVKFITRYAIKNVLLFADYPVH